MSKYQMNTKIHPGIQVLLVKGYYPGLEQHEFSKMNHLDFRYTCFLKQDTGQVRYPKSLIYNLIKALEEYFSSDEIIVQKEYYEYRSLFQDPNTIIKKLINKIYRAFKGIMCVERRFHSESFATFSEYVPFGIQSNSRDPEDPEYVSFSVILKKNKNIIAFADEEDWYCPEDVSFYTDSYALVVYSRTDVSAELTNVFRNVCKTNGINEVSLIDQTMTKK